MSICNPKRVAAKLQKVVDAWTTIRPTKSFAGMTLEQFKTRRKCSRRWRRGIN
jgi:hypothetical protein